VTPVVLLCLGAAVLALDWIPRTVLAVGVLPVVAVALMIIGIVGYTRRDLAV
jgi:ABC-2 type transport system permease protein